MEESAMSGRNEIATLAIALFVTLGLLGVGIWLFKQPLSKLLGHSSSSSTSNPITTYKTFAEVPDVPSGLFNYGGSTTWIPKCTIKALPIGRQSQQWVKPYQEPLISPQDCINGQRNQLNAPAFQNGDYPITRRLFVIVKQNEQIDRQAGEAYAQLLLSDQGQELITRSGFVRLH
jgi:phosphate transport system substrate-binding protein